MCLAQGIIAKARARGQTDHISRANRTKNGIGAGLHNTTSCHANCFNAGIERAGRTRRAIVNRDVVASSGVAHIFRARIAVGAVGWVVGVDAGTREAVSRRPTPAIREIGRWCADALARCRALIGRSAREAVIARCASGDGCVITRGTGAARAVVAGAWVVIGVALVAGSFR